MEVTYRTRALEKVCTDFSTASRKYGYRMTELIFKRIEQIQYADDVEGLISTRIGRCHALKGDRQGQYAMDLVHPYRLVFERIGNVVQIARIVEILDFVKWTIISGMQRQENNMKITESKTYIATPQRETIQELLEDQGKSVKDFAHLMGLSYRIDMKRLHGIDRRRRTTRDGRLPTM